MNCRVFPTGRMALVFGLSMLLAGGCFNIKDEDRCLEGFTYDSEENECVPDEDAGVGVDAAPVDAEVTADASTPGEDGGTISGLWDDCETAAECTGDADYCAYSPQGQVGYCTVTGCTAGSCPTGFQCCDCSAVSWPVMCADETNTMIPMFCTCPAP